MKSMKYILIAVLFLFTAVSCDKFEEINTDPNKTTKVTSAMLATQVLKDTYRFWNPNASDFIQGNLFFKHIAYLDPSPYVSQYYYSNYPYGSFGSFTRLTDMKYMIQYAEGGVEEPSYRGLALFMKAWFGFNATLDMGDIPYSETGMALEGITKPVYDKQADVFAAILTDLQQAEAFFAEGRNFAGDIMFGGDPAKWRRLCNAMQLKVIQTMSKKATADQKARFAAIVNAGNLMTGNNDNFKLVFSTNANAVYPMWANGETFRIKTGPSELAVDALKNFKDRRLFYFAEPAQAQITGGLTEQDWDAYVGAPTELAPDQLALNNATGSYSLLSRRYVKYMDNDPMLYFTYSEQCFIIAEGIEEGWVTGNAQTWYENGVIAILNYYRTLPHTAGEVHGMEIDQAYIDGYFTDAAAYATAGTKQDRLEQIWMQRWLLDFYQGNGGNYPQFLRTGYPVFPLDPATSLNPEDDSVYPKRWMYPTDERTKNPENYQKAIDEQYGGYDGINQVPWYIKD